METSITCKKSGIPVPRTINRNRSFQSSLSIDLDDSTTNHNDIERSIMSYSFHSNEKKPPSRVTQMVSRFSDSKPVSPINKTEVPIQGMTRTIQKRFSESREDKPPQVPVPEIDSKSTMWKDKASSLMKMLESEKQEKERLENVNQKLTHVIKSLNSERPDMQELKEQNLKIRKTLDNILPDTLKKDGIKRMNSVPEFVTPQELEYLINEIETLKANHNNLELQLYEANEKISDMIEQKQQLEQENQRLTIENVEFSQVAKLVTDNMKESIDTNKRMDETFYRVKAHRDELIKANRDSCDGATSPGLGNNGLNNEVKKLKAEIEIQEAKYKAQFIEYQKTMEAELARNSNEQITKYQVRLDLMEKDLAKALERAEKAEKEVSELRKHLHESVDSDQQPQVSVAAIPVPPPPPPMPPCLNGPPTTKSGTSILNQKLQQHEPTTPIKKQSATGLDAVIDDLKNGRATLRRRPALNSQSNSNSKLNPILREMYELLEKSKQRNRNSKLLVENETISLAYDIQTLNI